MTGPVVQGGEVWVLDFEAEGPEAGDYDGWQSVHATPDGATNRFNERLREHVDVTEPAEDYNRTSAEDGSWSLEMNYRLGSIKISASLHRMPVEP